ncbi:hypothetical protein [Bradyrhizobium prioriisuperbiae]|uniref:hypothetical protein n=1 Tax=Bradyrhizobium prioriisuperbiae TaxID=2854389 RepID=UPI0028E1A33D|nr:hypothetical protein [Bradyrhizobium prioritasuperba]
MAEHAAERTAARVAGRDVLVVQDTSELALGGRRAKANGYGPVGKGGALRGLLLHAVLAVDAGTGAVLGLVDAPVRNRSGGKVKSRRSRTTAQKESQRWLDGTARAGGAGSGAEHHWRIGSGKRHLRALRAMSGQHASDRAGVPESTD